MAGKWQAGQSGNPRGRPRDAERMHAPTKAELREREFLMLLRKIRPHIADSIRQCAEIVNNDKANDSNRIKAAALLLLEYRKLVADLYTNNPNKDEDEDTGQEIQQENRAPVFSLKVVSDEEETKQET